LRNPHFVNKANARLPVRKAGCAIDFAVGISGIKKIGEHVDLDEPSLFVHARTEQTLSAVLPLLEKAVSVG
jgi:thymidine phosphorylase